MVVLTSFICGSHLLYSQNAEPTRRVVFLGDSITCGVGTSSPSNRYSSVATALLRADFPGLVEINLGKSGQSLCQQGEDYPDEVLKQNPDMVVIQWGVNDQYWGYSIAQYALAYDRLVSALRRAKPDMPIVLTTLVADFRSDNADQWNGEANVLIQELAVKYVCHLADIHHAIDHKREYYKDTIHPNDQGAKIMASTVYKAFKEEPRSKANMQLSFDQGKDVRFMRYVFIPKRAGEAPCWISFAKKDDHHFEFNTPIPLSIRIPIPDYKDGEYTLEIKDASNQVVSTSRCKVGYPKIVIIILEPKEYKLPLAVSMKPFSKGS